MPNSDMQGFPRPGMPTLKDEDDRFCLGTLYDRPLKSAGFIIDVVGNNRLLGALTIGGALTGATTGTFSSNVSMTGLTASSITLGAGFITLTGSLGSTLARSSKGWFNNLEISNAPTVLGNPMPLMEDLAFLRNNWLKINQTTPQTTVGTFTFPSVNVTNNLNIGSGKTIIYADGSGNTADGNISWTTTGEINLLTASMTGQSLDFMDGTYLINADGLSKFDNLGGTGDEQVIAAAGDTFKIYQDGKVCVGIDAVIMDDGTYAINATGKSNLNGAVTLGAGTDTAGTAPLKFKTGTLLTAAEAGAIEYRTDTFYIRGTDKVNFANTLTVGNVTGATSTTAAGLSIKNAAAVVPSQSLDLFTCTDPNYPSGTAGVIASSVDNTRLFFGKSGKIFYSLDFTYVTNFINVPTLLTLVAGTLDGLSCSRIASATSYLVIDVPVNAGNGYISSRASADASRNSLQFMFHALDTNTYKLSAGFVFAGKGTSATWTSPHTIWTNNTQATTLMTLSNSGMLGIMIAPTALLTLAAGTATAGTAPLKLTLTGAILTTVAVAGQVEPDATTSLYYTDITPTRKKFLFSIGQITTVTDTYGILATDETVICNKATAFTCILPTGVVGQQFSIKNIGAGLVTVSLGGDTIDGETSQTVDQWSCMKIQCSAANTWIII